MVNFHALINPNYFQCFIKIDKLLYINPNVFVSESYDQLRENKSSIRRSQQRFRQRTAKLPHPPIRKTRHSSPKHTGSEEAAAIGSLSTLYKGLSELDTAHFSTRGAKEMLLNPRSYLYEICRFLAVDVAGTGTLPCFLCRYENCTYKAFVNISMYSNIAKCECRNWLNRETRVGVCWNYKGGAFVESPWFSSSPMILGLRLLSPEIFIFLPILGLQTLKVLR